MGSWGFLLLFCFEFIFKGTGLSRKAGETRGAWLQASPSQSRAPGPAVSP